ncbi:hypothetical protein BDY19DRAFT_889612, partial [Irpex rosettiformis]
PIVIVTDSMYCMNGILYQAKKWEATGWINTKNKELFQAILSWCRRRPARISFKWVKGHSGKRGNEEADKLANEGSHKEKTEGVNLRILPQFLPQGLQVNVSTQKLIEKGIKELEQHKPRKSTEKNLELTVQNIEEQTGKAVSKQEIWKGIRSPINGRKIRVFLWKMMHQAMRCGAWWKNIPNNEDRSQCTKCDVEESMHHILLECTAPGRQTIWNLATREIRRKTGKETEINLGTIMGANLIKILDKEGQDILHQSRLQQIIITESAYLIWKIRCERVIEKGTDQGNWHSEREISERWRAMLRRRMSFDFAMTHPKLPKSKRLDPALVKETWSNVRMNLSAINPRVFHSPGVLVGRLTEDNRIAEEEPNWDNGALSGIG